MFGALKQHLIMQLSEKQNSSVTMYGERWLNKVYCGDIALHDFDCTFSGTSCDYQFGVSQSKFCMITQLHGNK